GGTRYRRGPRRGSRSSSPTCAATEAQPSPTPSRPTRCPFSPETCWQSWPSSRSAGRMWSVTTGARPSRGRSPPLHQTRSTTWLRCRSATPVTFLRTLEQRQMSWYMLLFQFPGIAERWLTADNWAGFRSWAHHPDTGQVIADLEATGSLTPGLNWYRANLPPESWAGPPPQLPPVQASTMGIWSTGDLALTERQM